MHKTKIAIGILVGLSLAGCGNMASNRTVYSVHQPVVERVNYAIDLSTASTGGIPSHEQGRLAGWFEALDLGYGDRIAVDYGGGYADRAAMEAVEEEAAQRGLLVSETAPVTNGRILPGTVRVVVTRSVASVPSCPDWSATSDTNFNSATHSNYGCATNSNYAAMVADAEDLVGGNGYGTADPSQASKAIEAYRERESTAGQVGGSGLGD